jgi:hypothetical protein
MFFPAGNAVAISLWENLECLIAMDTCDVHLNFLKFEAFEGQPADGCSLVHLVLFSYMFAKNEAPHNGAPYRSISMNGRLLDSLFRKEYRYG